MSLGIRMKYILVAVVFCVSFVIAQKDLTSYQRDERYVTIEEFPLAAKPIWLLNVNIDNCHSGAVIGSNAVFFVEGNKLKSINVKTGEILW
jgi:hypothetical protein